MLVVMTTAAESGVKAVQTTVQKCSKHLAVLCRKQLDKTTTLVDPEAVYVCSLISLLATIRLDCKSA